METKVIDITQYDPSVAIYCPKGISMTVPNEATSLKDLVHRAMASAQLPDIAKSLEYGDDEDFDDAFEPGQDLADYCENKEYIERYSDAIKKAKIDLEAKKKADKEIKAKDEVTEPLEKESV